MRNAFALLLIIAALPSAAHAAKKDAQLSVSVQVLPQAPKIETVPCYDAKSGKVLEMPVAASLDGAYRASTRLLELPEGGRVFVVEINY